MIIFGRFVSFSAVFDYAYIITIFIFFFIWFGIFLGFGGMLYREEIEFWPALIELFQAPFVKESYFHRDGTFDLWGAVLVPFIWPLPFAFVVLRSFLKKPLWP